jgi:hypothetical protein
MFLTLLVVPTAYSLLESVTWRVGRLFRRRTSLQTEPAGAVAGGNGIGNGIEHPAGATLRLPTMPSASSGTHNQGDNHDTSNGTQTIPAQTDSQDAP